MTNEMVLERTSNLVMPSHYVELDSDEMSYVDGGYELIKKHILWWDITIGISLSATECADLAAFCAGGATLSLLITEPAVSKALAIVLGLGSAFFWLASNHNGMNIYGRGICIIKW